MIGQLRQDQDYHRFADGRMFLGIDNAADTLSSLTFLLAGALGLLFLWRERASRMPPRFAAPEEMLPYWAFFGAITLTGFGSMYYHLVPNDSRLVWDRLPMSIAFMSLLAAVIAERVSKAAGVRLLLPLITLGAASVLYWPVSALFGSEDLRPYVAVQLGSIGMVLALCAMFPSRYAKGGTIFIVAALYGIAKFFELKDREIYELGHWISGHTLKHLAAAAAVYMLVRWLQRRTPREKQGAPSLTPRPEPLAPRASRAPRRFPQGSRGQ
jgi:hypothetical protein